MANPRRSSYASTLPISDSIPQFQSQPPQSSLFASLKVFLKKPHAFPLLLSIFLLLTWVSLRLQRPSRPSSSSFRQSSSYGATTDHYKDSDTNIVRFSTSSSIVMKDGRGWLINPVSLAMDLDLTGGAISCASTHVGEIRPRKVRGNHRHHTCNETFVIWGAKTLFRLENNALKKGYSEAIIGADEVAVAVSPSGTAHALVNIDAVRSTLFLGCQDGTPNYNASTNDFKVWKDL